MRFDLTEDQRLARDVVQRFLSTEQPLSAVRATLEEPSGFDAELWKKMSALGWTSPLVPDEHGGASISDAPVVDLTVIAAEIGRAVAPGPFLETNVAIDALVRSDNADLRDRHLPGLLEGSAVAGWWLQRSPTSGIVIDRHSNGDVCIDGEITATLPTQEALLLLSGPTATCLLERETSGVSVRALKWLDASTRHAVVSLDNVRLPAGQALSTGPDEVERARRLAWVLQAAELTGVVDAVFGLTLDWLANRYLFGRPLASYQALKHRCADMKMWVEATHAVADAAADAVGAESRGAGLLARAAKAYAAAHAVELIQDCVQLHGGMCVTWEHDLHLYLRRATLIANSYGTPADLYAEVAATEVGEATP
ncbi:acyl-CoA dehydrogenase family protein [Mycobacterium stomatepiae]|uniref:Acyl-CoA dehydrogenase n=1 Tax=Mycobacterium stomatepiae TaxID=470076 RepID=A0A7I7Q766_9MYCO|nr:acyl-CoA dehydrogenase family protein [Mycobacterium stomatepiae]MCV7163023.1 acyl-CoA/acyl-ACP dehydrogenase [Mycobacterium stomatepiae]BBY22168.1 acyl-CoA dehydrogenase [Mycobacterium stomatepiae]